MCNIVLRQNSLVYTVLYSLNILVFTQTANQICFDIQRNTAEFLWIAFRKNALSAFAQH